MTTLTDTLDLALDRLMAGEPVDAVVRDCAHLADELGPLLATAARLRDLPPAPAPGAQLADRNQFLLDLALLQVAPVSTTLLNRLTGRMVHLLTWLRPPATFQKKEIWRMSTAAIALTLIVSLFLGSVRGVATLAAAGLPGTPVYPVKLLLEQVSLALTTDPAQVAERHLQLAHERSREIQRLALNGEAPAQDALSRLQLHLELANQYATGLNAEAHEGAMLQVRETAREQARVLAQLEGEVEEPVRAALRAARRIWAQAGQAAGEPIEHPEPGGPPIAPPQPSLEPPRQPLGSQDPPSNEQAPTGQQHQHGQPAEPGPNPGGQEEAPAGEQQQHGQPAEPGANPGGQEEAPAGEQQQHGQPAEPGANPGGQEESPAGEQQQHGQPAEPGANPGGQEESPAGEQQQHGQPAEPDPAPGGQEESPAGEQQQHGQPAEAGQGNQETEQNEQQSGGESAGEGQNGESGSSQGQGGGRGGR